MIGQPKKDECFIVIKAQPHRSSKYFETVCCAGVGRDGKWRRQYPVPFRILDNSQQFSRWQWISYEFVTSDHDRRIESQKVDASTLLAHGKIKPSERTRLLSTLVRESFDEADDKGESLTLIRPRKITLNHEQKSASELRHETEKHEHLANQLSLFDNTAKPIIPCPVRFSLNWIDPTGKRRRHENDDWETSAAYNRFSREYGHEKAIQYLKEKYEDQYMKSGLVLGFSTHSRRNVTYGSKNQWLLVGLIRLDFQEQNELLF